MKPLFSIVVISSSAFVTAAAARADEVRPDMVFILIGQSNMAGRAPLLPQDEQALPNVFLLNGENAWEPAANPLNRYASNRKVLSMQRMGPGAGFVQRLRKEFPDRTIGLIVNARGGTSIEEWAKGKELYDNTLKRVRAAGELRLAGVLWHQGEANSKDPQYTDKLIELVQTLRADLNAPELPFVAGQVAKDSPVNDHIAQLPAKLPRSAFASAAGLSVFDGVHFDRESQLTLGERYAEAYLSIVGKNK